MGKNKDKKALKAVQAKISSSENDEEFDDITSGDEAGEMSAGGDESGESSQMFESGEGEMSEEEEQEQSNAEESSDSPIAHEKQIEAIDAQISESASEEESEEQEEAVEEQSEEDSKEARLLSQIKNSKKEESKIQSTSGIDPEVLQRIIERDSPELNTMLDEYLEAMDVIQVKLKPVLEKVRASVSSGGSGADDDQILVTKDGMSFLEMKYNLMLTYCQMINFYMLLKLQGKDVQSHPVIDRLLHLKLLLEKVRPLDVKMQYQVDKMVRQAVLEQTDGRPAQGKDRALSYRPNISLMEAEKSESSGGEEADKNEEEDEEDASESEIEEDVGAVVKTKKKQRKDSSDEEATSKPGVYKASKMNPMLYQDGVNKQAKKIQQKDQHAKHTLNKSNYIKMLREDMDDRPEEVAGRAGLGAKTKYMKEMEELERVETENFTRMQMTKAQKKYHKKMLAEGDQDKLDHFDELKDLEHVLYQRAEREEDSAAIAAGDGSQSKFHQSLKKIMKKKMTTRSNDSRGGNKSQGSNKRQKTR